MDGFRRLPIECFMGRGAFASANPLGRAHGTERRQMNTNEHPISAQEADFKVKSAFRRHVK